MRTGKVSEAVLRRSVLGRIEGAAADWMTPPGIGVDFASAELADGERVVLSMNPVTRTGWQIGRRGVCEALNNVACSGARPIGVLISILLPTSADERELRVLMDEITRCALEMGAVVLGGHTEVTRRVLEPLVTVTGVGAAVSGARARGMCDESEGMSSFLKPGGVRPGMDLLVSKWVGLEGTALLCHEFEDDLKRRFAVPFLEEARSFLRYHSILPEAAIAADNGAAALHDVSEGGIYGALWEFAQSSDVGLEVDLHRLPIRQETVEICEFFDINPYKLISGGCLLIAAENGGEIARALSAAGISAAVIGHATDSGERILLSGEERRFLERTQRDELYKVID